MKVYRYLLIALIGCLVATADACANNLAPQKTGTEVLAETLGTLNLSNPIADLDANLKKHDRRFIGINGYTCTAPGVSDSDWSLVHSGTYGLNCLAGTGDVIENNQHRALIDKAEAYATTYNIELLRRIRAGLV